MSVTLLRYAWSLVVFNLIILARGGYRGRRSIGGEIARKGENPWLVSLWYMLDNDFTIKTGLHHVCGAAIIAPKFLLTSAECFENNFMQGAQNLSNWWVVAGKYSQIQNETTNQWKRIKYLHWHPEFNPLNITADLAVLELMEPLDLRRPGVKPIRYEDNDGCVTTHRQCLHYGWGQQHERPYGFGVALPRRLNLQLGSDCRLPSVDTQGRDYVIDERIICAGGRGLGPCAGDLGSPLVCTCNNKSVLAGIVTLSWRCSQVGIYSFFSRVSYFLPWIKYILEGRSFFIP